MIQRVEAGHSAYSLAASAESESPAELVERVAERRLEDSGYRVLSRVRCRFEAGILTLSGRVPSFYMKQVAQTLVMSLHSVQKVDNRLDVHDGC